MKDLMTSNSSHLLARAVAREGHGYTTIACSSCYCCFILCVLFGKLVLTTDRIAFALSHFLYVGVLFQCA